MGVPLGHRNHRGSSGGYGRSYRYRYGYEYEVELVNNPILGEVYKLTIVSTFGSGRLVSERFIFKSPKWKRNPILTEAFNKNVPRYREHNVIVPNHIFVTNDGCLYTDDGKSFYKVKYLDEFSDEPGGTCIIPEGVTTLKNGCIFRHLDKMILPQSLTTLEEDSFWCATIDELIIKNKNLDFSGLRYFPDLEKVYIPIGSKDFYINHFKDCLKGYYSKMHFTIIETEF